MGKMQESLKSCITIKGQGSAFALRKIFTSEYKLHNNKSHEIEMMQALNNHERIVSGNGLQCFTGIILIVKNFSQG